MQINIKPVEPVDKTYVLELTSTEMRDLIQEINTLAATSDASMVKLFDLSSIMRVALRRFE